MAETLELYEKSISKTQMDQITNYLSTFKVGDPLQKATRELIITFASNETGHVMSKRLADQRRYLKEEFDKHKSDAAQRLLFVRNFREVADFTKYAWDSQDGSISLNGLPVDACTNVVKLCLAFLKSLNHSITVGPMIRFYSEALSASEEERPQKIRDLEAAIKAITAFSAIWRASRRGTKNIDKQYREILVGSNDKTTALLPLARVSKKGSLVDVNLLKEEIRARLFHKDLGGLSSKDDFVNQAAGIPAYTNNRSLSRFLLLAAYKDAIADPNAPGLITKGKPSVSHCFTYEGFKDENHLTLEHIAPQENSGGTWDTEIYSDKETIHRIGNLVLVPQVANSSFSDRPWNQKRVLYKVLGAGSYEAAKQILDDAKLEGIGFGASTNALLETSKHLPQLAALGDLSDKWTPEFIESRSKRILTLAYQELYSWLL